MEFGEETSLQEGGRTRPLFRELEETLRTQPLRRGAEISTPQNCFCCILLHLIRILRPPADPNLRSDKSLPTVRNGLHVVAAGPTVYSCSNGKKTVLLYVANYLSPGDVD
jgi:hypothetical protein